MRMLLRLPQRALILLVRGYRFALKPWLGSACHFEPTCSQYALDALERVDARVLGTVLTMITSGKKTRPGYYGAVTN